MISKSSLPLRGKKEIFIKPKELKSFISELLANQKKEIIKRLEKLMPANRAQEIGDQMELMTGQRSCKLCGSQPEKQREMILEELGSLKEER